MALMDLKIAHELDPSDTLIRREYFALRHELRTLRQKDLKSFGGLFERSSLQVDDTSTQSSTDGTSTTTESSPLMTIKDALQSLQDAESAAERYYRDGKVKKSEELKASIAKSRAELNQYIETQNKENAVKKKTSIRELVNMDFTNPTDEMRQHARSCGLDLDDPL
jgi:hypothetical protein